MSPRRVLLKLGDNDCERGYGQRGERVGGNFVSGRLRPTSLALSGVVPSAGFVSESALGNGATGGRQRKGKGNRKDQLTLSAFLFLNLSLLPHSIRRALKIFRQRPSCLQDSDSPVLIDAAAPLDPESFFVLQ